MTINKRQDAGYKVWEVDLLLEQIKSLEAKNTDLLQEWAVQAVECQELEKQNKRLDIWNREQKAEIAELKEQIGEF
tara:strand:- start:243 stop:470 length:228 start_codon:yes stop_codon:yes gene_type:complete